MPYSVPYRSYFIHRFNNTVFLVSYHLENLLNSILVIFHRAFENKLIITNFLMRDS